jgi:sulfite oxidase
MPKKINKINSSRRSFLAGSATVAGAAAAASVMPISIASANHTEKGARGLPSWTAWKKRSALIIHSDKGMETHRAAIGNSVITPLRHVYIRNNMPTMSDAQIGNRNKWKLKVEGVKNPKTYTLAQLKQLAQKTEATILQCSGNGRGFFAHKVRGSQWETGAAACLIWTGCPVSAIVKDCGGLASGVKFLTATGADMPKQLNPKKALVERSIPVKAQKDAFVAWEVNGVNIPNSHGGPLRMVTPGYFGINNVKHVGKLAFTAKESSVKYMKSSYRISPIGKKGSQYPSCWEMPVKSWIVSPLKSAKSGNIVVSGVAMGGTKKVSNIKVSVDGGKSWKKAKFTGPDMGKFAWRRFVFETKLKPGSYKIVSKASAGGKSQPKLRMENRRGYAHNGWLDHGVDIKVS